MTLRSALKGASAPLALSVALIASPAFAQDENIEIVLTQSDIEESEPDGATIFVTGSRIRRDEFTAPAPLTIINPELAIRKGLMDTGEMIQGSPIAAGSSQVTAAISSNFLTNGGIGAATVSLRGLGAERTLVLLNGRRAGPSGTRGSVSSFDLNVLPQSIVEQVEVLKDGASSIYGSDAVAGVVNLITRTDTDGVEFNLFGSVPFDSGGETFSASATWGKTFDRGHILVSANYHRQNEMTRGNRSYLQCPENYVFTDESLSTRADLIDPRTGDYACAGSSANPWGHVWTYDYSYTDFDPEADSGRFFDGLDVDGLANKGHPNGSNIPGSAGNGGITLFQYSYGDDNLGSYIPGVTRTDSGQIGTPEGWFPVAYDATSTALQNNYHPQMNSDSVIPESNRFTAYLDASYELMDGVEFYTELLYNKRDNFVNRSGQVYQFGLGEIYDYYYDYDIAPALDAGGNPTFLRDANGDLELDQFGNPVMLLEGNGLQFSDPVFGGAFDPYAAGWQGPALFSPTAFNPFIDSSVSVEYFRAVTGLRGDITSNWSYDIYGQYSQSNGTYRDQTALKDAIACGNFRSGAAGYNASSCPGGISPISGRENVIVDWFSPRVLSGTFTPEEYNFLFAWDEGHTKYTQIFGEAIVSGDLVDLWAGTVGVALGGTIREDEINDTPGEIRQADNGFSFGGAGITAGKTLTKEAFGEISIPLLNGIPFIERLDFTGAARVTNVTATRASDGLQDTDNGNWTYKLGLDWEVTDWLRFRGTYGTSFRAPALFELFLADQTGSLSQRADPCVQWAFNLAQSNISQQFADNCATQVGPNHIGSGIPLSVVSGGGIGELDPETSKAWTASIILTPSFDFLPNTQLSLAIDYFDIEVNGEIAQFGASALMSACYGSNFFLDDPLCNQFFRFDQLEVGSDLYNQYYQPGDGENIAVVFDSFFNINSQQNRGIDVTARAVHDFAGDATLTFQSQATWQTRDRISLFDGFFTDYNGQAGEPIFVADVNLSLDTGPWTFFYGIDIIGGTDNTERYLLQNDTTCPTFDSLGTVCLDLTLPATFYHSASVTREFGGNFVITAGLSNLFNTSPPRSSDLGGNSDGIQQFGQGTIHSQYDLIGRRAFVNLNVRY